MLQMFYFYVLKVDQVLHMSQYMLVADGQQPATVA
jgi:hypothetical protein